MVVLRESVASENDLYEIIDVDLTKKSGKGLGLSIVGKKNGPGIFVSDVVSINIYTEYRIYSFSGLGAYFFKRPQTPATIGGPALIRGPALNISLKFSAPVLEKIGPEASKLLRKLL